VKTMTFSTFLALALVPASSVRATPSGQSQPAASSSTSDVQSAETVHYLTQHPITPPPNAVYEQETYNPDRQIVSKWILSSFADGRWARQHFDDETGLKVVLTVIWDGKYERQVDFEARSVTSYRMYPEWGAQQMTVLVKQAATRELKGVTPDPSVLVVPSDFEEHTPSEVQYLLAAATGVSFPPCEDARLLRDDGFYFAYQVEKPFAIERIIHTTGNPRILYQVYKQGTVVRSDFLGTDIKVIVLNPFSMERWAIDRTSKSVTTYPWDRTDTSTWKEIVRAPDNLKSDMQLSPADEEQYTKKPEGFTERSPSETYLAHMDVVGEKPDPQHLAIVKSRDAIYRQGQEELAKRSTCLASKDSGEQKQQ
jgi:hypothetical protein